MKLSDYDPSNFYNNRGYKAITSNPNGIYNNYNPSSNRNNPMHPKPRTSNLASRPVDKQELSQAQMALKSLKAKMGSAPRRPNPIMNIGANGTRKFIPTFDIDGQMNSQNYPTKPVNCNSEELRQIAKGSENTYVIPSDYILCKFAIETITKRHIRNMYPAVSGDSKTLNSAGNIRLIPKRNIGNKTL